MPSSEPTEAAEMGTPLRLAESDQQLKGELEEMVLNDVLGLAGCSEVFE